MTTTRVEFTGDIPGALRRASRPIADSFATQGLVMLQRNCPVDTGELRASCYSNVVERPGQDLSVALGATADHAGPVEFGHLRRDGSFQPPNPFIRRTLSQLTRGRR
jgi:hypothetical protein